VDDGADHLQVAQFFCTYIVIAIGHFFHRTCKLRAAGAYALPEVVDMAKKALILESCPVVRADSPFVRYFQTQTISCKRARGFQTESQADRATRAAGTSARYAGRRLCRVSPTARQLTP
jgi:hypothetical protein